MTIMIIKSADAPYGFSPKKKSQIWSWHIRADTSISFHFTLRVNST